MRNYKTWFWAVVIFQFLTAVAHSLSFLNEPVAQNEQEKLLFDLMRNYRRDLAGTSVSTEELMTALSACFSLLYLFGALANGYLLRRTTDRALHGGILWINLVVFGICFAVMAAYTFLPPIALTGAVFFFLLLAKIIHSASKGGANA